MLRPDVVEYLRAHLKKFPVDTLREQLLAEGVSEQEFEDSLQEALRTSKKKPAAKTVLARALVTVGLGSLILATLVALSQKPSQPRTTVPAPQGGSAFIGHHGYIVRLPPGYVAVKSFKDRQKTVERVYFCKAGTDPGNFLNIGLYGQLGIVRLEAGPNPFAGTAAGPEDLSRLVVGRGFALEEKHRIANVQIGSLQGLQIDFQAPLARVETYLLGQNALYYFTGGADDEIFREILQSLRETPLER